MLSQNWTTKRSSEWIRKQTWKCLRVKIGSVYKIRMIYQSETFIHCINILFRENFRDLMSFQWSTNFQPPTNYDKLWGIDEICYNFRLQVHSLQIPYHEWIFLSFQGKWEREKECDLLHNYHARVLVSKWLEDEPQRVAFTKGFWIPYYFL